MPRRLVEHVHDHVAVVDHDPLGVLIPGNRDRTLAERFQGRDYFVSDTLNVALRCAARDDEVIREGRDLSDAECARVQSPLVDDRRGGNLRNLLGGESDLGVRREIESSLIGY